jgi:hypothetical protein
MEMLAVKTVARTRPAAVAVQEKLAAQIALVMVAMGVSIHNLALMAHLLVSLLAAAVAVQQGPDQVDQVVAVLALLAKALVLLQLQIPVAVVAQLTNLTAHLILPVALAVQVLSLFVMLTLMNLQHQQLVHQLTLFLVGIVFMHLPLQVQSHSEAQHESFCKSRKRHRYTSYCGQARRY